MRMGLPADTPQYHQPAPASDSAFLQDIAPQARVVIYNGCAAIGALDDDILGTLDILNDEALRPAYNCTRHHEHRMFGKAVDDFGGIVPDQLQDVFQTFLVDTLRITSECAKKLIPNDSLKFHVEIYEKLTLDIFERQRPGLYEFKILEKQVKVADETGDYTRKATLLVETKDLNKVKLTDDKGKVVWNRTPKIIPYELLYRDTKAREAQRL